MKRNFLRLCLMTAVTLSFHSCRQELLQSEQEYALQSQKSTIQQLLRTDLEKKDPQMMGKVDQLQVKKASGNARIYTDTENGFTVDTEKAILVEDAHGNKTYTFYIERNNGSSSGFLENLVLKQTGASEYTAYISKYDQMAVENLGSIAQNDLKNHITFTPLGTKTGAEIFGKYDANSNCNVMMPYASNWVQVSGTLCYTGDHDYAHIGQCNYESAGQAGPTPGYYTYEISYGPVDICGSGGGFTPGNTPTTGGTTPVHSSGGGAVLDIDPTDPCNILKSNLQFAKQLITKPDVKDQNDLMKASIVTDPYEKAFCFGKNSGEISDIKEGNSTNVKLNIDNVPFNPYGIIHNHNELIGYTDFSPADINAFHYYIKKRNTVQYLYVNGADGSMYVMTIQDQDAYDAFITQYPDSVFEANADWKEGLDIRDDEDNVLQYFIKQGKTSDEANDLTLGYLISAYNMGIMISKKGTDGNFHPIQVEKVETTDQITGKIAVSYQKINPCNL